MSLIIKAVNSISKNNVPVYKDIQYRFSINYPKNNNKKEREKKRKIGV
jgi:hypothetical protein